MTTPTTEASATFGWCLTDAHRHCRAEFTYHGKRIRCGCSCHRRDEP